MRSTTATIVANKSNATQGPVVAGTGAEGIMGVQGFGLVRAKPPALEDTSAQSAQLPADGFDIGLSTANLGRIGPDALTGLGGG